MTCRPTAPLPPPPGSSRPAGDGTGRLDPCHRPGPARRCAQRVRPAAIRAEGRPRSARRHRRNVAPTSWQPNRICSSTWPGGPAAVPSCWSSFSAACTRRLSSRCETAGQNWSPIASPTGCAPACSSGWNGPPRVPARRRWWRDRWAVLSPCAPQRTCLKSSRRHCCTGRRPAPQQHPGRAQQTQVLPLTSPTRASGRQFPPDPRSLDRQAAAVLLTGAPAHRGRPSAGVQRRTGRRDRRHHLAACSRGAERD